MKKSIPEHITAQKQIEEGGTIHKFTRLSQFTEDLIDKEEKKIKRLLRGFLPGIHKDVTTVIRPQTYDDAIKRAYWSREENENITQSRESTRKNWQPAAKNNNQEPQQQYYQQNNRVRAYPEYQRTMKCDRCKRITQQTNVTTELDLF